MSIKHIEMGIEKRKRRKSPGTEQIPTKLIKAVGRTIRSDIHKTFHSILNKEELPEEWKYGQVEVRECLLSFGAESFFFQLVTQNIKITIYRTIILRVVLYGCETWSLTLREERRLSAFENRVLRRVFGSERDEVTGEWRRLHNEELNDLYSSPSIVRVIE
jgi:hypothetical protein